MVFELMYTINSQLVFFLIRHIDPTIFRADPYFKVNLAQLHPRKI